MSEVEKWQLIPIPCHVAKCKNCGHTEHEEGSANKAMIRLKFYGWQLRDNGPWCNECVREDEMSSDNSVVRPK